MLTPVIPSLRACVVHRLLKVPKTFSLSTSQKYFYNSMKNSFSIVSVDTCTDGRKTMEDETAGD
jgi:hypothetical protein